MRQLTNHFVTRYSPGIIACWDRLPPSWWLTICGCQTNSSSGGDADIAHASLTSLGLLVSIMLVDHLVVRQNSRPGGDADIAHTSLTSLGPFASIVLVAEIAHASLTSLGPFVSIVLVADIAHASLTLPGLFPSIVVVDPVLARQPVVSVVRH